MVEPAKRPGQDVAEKMSKVETSGGGKAHDMTYLDKFTRPVAVVTSEVRRVGVLERLGRLIGIGR